MPSENPFKHGNPLRKHLGFALQCNQTALLYATKLSDEPLVNHLSDNFRLKQDGASVPEPEPFEYITSIYSEAFFMLQGRLNETTRIYLSLLEDLRDVSVADRQEESLLSSSKLISVGFQDLINEIVAEHRAAKQRGASKPIGEYALEWRGLSNMCGLFMKEITYLGARVDVLQSLLHAERSQLATQAALSYAVWAIVLNAILVLVSVYISIMLHNASA